jgi:hypothetical protein
MEKPCIDRKEQVMQKLAVQVNRWGLTSPAILGLEILKPFSFLASQGLLLCQPLLSFFYDNASLTDYAELLADRSNLDRLIANLEGREVFSQDSGKETSR